MNFFLILFAVSLIGIVAMIGRKLRMAMNGQSLEPGSSFAAFDLETAGHNAVRFVRRLGYFLLVEMIRVYVRLSESSRREWAEWKEKMKHKLEDQSASSRRPNKFLRAMATYKRKLRMITREVREEEGLE